MKNYSTTKCCTSIVSLIKYKNWIVNCLNECFLQVRKKYISKIILAKLLKWQYNLMSRLMKKLTNTLSSFNNLLDSNEMNISFTSSLDLDIETEDPTINAELISQIYSNYVEIENNRLTNNDIKALKNWINLILNRKIIEI